MSPEALTAGATYTSPVPSVPVLIGVFVSGVVVAYGFAFTAIGLIGELAALLAAVALIIRGLGYVGKQVHRAATRR